MSSFSTGQKPKIFSKYEKTKGIGRKKKEMCEKSRHVYVKNRTQSLSETKTFGTGQVYV